MKERESLAYSAAVAAAVTWSFHIHTPVPIIVTLFFIALLQLFIELFRN